MACCGISSPALLFLFLSEYSQAKELVCVPVDVTDTLRCFRETLEKSKYHNRAIRHSRKLLSLFLAQTQGKNTCSVCLSPYLGGGATLRHILPEVPPFPTDKPTPCCLSLSSCLVGHIISLSLDSNRGTASLFCFYAFCETTILPV